MIPAPGQEKETVEITIKNLTRGLLLVPLNSRETLYLASGETSGTVPDFEISRNAKIEKMANRGLIKILRVANEEE